MKLNKNTLDVLKNFQEINQSILIRPGNQLTTLSPSKSVVGMVEIDQTFEKKVGIYDLRRFLGVLSIFDDPEIELDDNFLIIKDDVRSVRYNYADDQVIIALDEGKKIRFPSADIEFKLPYESLKKVLQAKSVLSVPDIAIASNGNDVHLVAFDNKNKGKEKEEDNELIKNLKSDFYSMKVAENNSDIKKFKALYRPENLNLLPVDYDVSISSHKISKFSSEDGKISYFIAIEEGSKF